MSLNTYLGEFSTIKMNASGGYHSPHKACLLLAIMDQVAEGELTDNRILLSNKLIQRFQQRFTPVAKTNDKADISQPFFYLQSSDFWHHKIISSQVEEYKQRTAAKQRNNGGINKVNQLIQYAYVDAELFEYFKSPIAREALTQVLLSKLDSEQQDKILIPPSGWNWNECELIVNDYFAMLAQELIGQKYNKAQHNRDLVEAMKESRSRSAIEHKHQNISAILKEMGMPIIDGYKPLSNYQRNILPDVIGAVVTQQYDMQKLIKKIDQQAVTVPTIENILDSLVEAPSVSNEVREKTPHNYQNGDYIRPKKDFLAQEIRNQALGLSGEKYVVNYEKARLIFEGKEALADRIEHISLYNDQAGYDIHSYNSNGEDRFVEVKTTNYDRYRQFYISSNELNASRNLGQNYHLYRVFNFNISPKLFITQGSLENGYNLSPSAYFANIK